MAKRRIVPSWLHRAVVRRDGGECRRCFAPAHTVHHVTAVADGGEDTLENAVLLCGACHNEWHHQAEPYWAVAFDAWLETPPMGLVAVALWRVGPADMTLTEFRRLAKSPFELISDARMQPGWKQALGHLMEAS